MSISQNSFRKQTASGSSRPPLVAVCGPIGTGKSTLLHNLAPLLGFDVQVERVEDNPFFERHMGDPARWAFRSQAAFLVGAIEDAAWARRRSGGALLERPAEEMFGVFVADMHRAGVIEDDEYALLGRLVKLGEQLGGRPDLLIVLRGEPDVLLDRVRHRGRQGEETYTASDMRRLEQAYDRWVGDWTDTEVITVDAVQRDIREPREVELLAAAVRAALAQAP